MEIPGCFNEKKIYFGRNKIKNGKMATLREKKVVVKLKKRKKKVENHPDPNVTLKENLP